MRLRVDASGVTPLVVLEAPEDCTALSIAAPGDRRPAAAWAIRENGLGVMTEDGTSLIVTDRLRDMARGQVAADWDARFDAMLDYARQRGWLAPDGRLWVHTEWLGSAAPLRGVSGDTFRHALSHFATGVTVVSGIAGDRPTGITCQSFMSLSLDPPLVAVAPSRASASWPLMAPAGVIGISILTDQQAEVSRRFAVTGADKFADLRWTPGPVTGVPLIDGALTCMECGIEAIHEAGDHYLVCARVIDITMSEGRPLLYFRSGVRALAS